MVISPAKNFAKARLHRVSKLGLKPIFSSHIATFLVNLRVITSIYGLLKAFRRTAGVLSIRLC